MTSLFPNFKNILKVRSLLPPRRRTQPERKTKAGINRFLSLNPNRNLYNLIDGNLTSTQSY